MARKHERARACENDCGTRVHRRGLPCDLKPVASTRVRIQVVRAVPDYNEILPRETMGHLLRESDGICWWCRSNPATTGEHKFKATDLTRLMSGDALIWGASDGQTRQVRGKSGIQRDRYGVVKFPKSLCSKCNNERSKPFDEAYTTFSDFVAGHPLTRHMPGIEFAAIFGSGWKKSTLDLARYYAKHFGCRMVADGIGAPVSLRDFMNGATDIPDCHMVLATTDSVHGTPLRNGLSISGAAASADRALTELIRYVAASYVGSVGVRFEWQKPGIPDEARSQFFHFPCPIINCFTDENAVIYGVPRRQGRVARFFQWMNSPS